ncbi:hypothetical protein C0991_002061 [Blastosporella zonata]|nr:hypothetical protein C0991_002061 [Blastosporella zonata]
MSPSSRIQFPTELLEKIIFYSWSSPLSNADRIALMASSSLVNTTWKALFHRISFRDAHIPSPAYLDLFIATLADRNSPLYPQAQSCQSITLKILPGADKDEEPPMGKTLSTLLYFLEFIDAPHLRTFHIEYENMSDFDDLLGCWRFLYFPIQITNLEISFSDMNTPTPGNAHVVRQTPALLPLDETEADFHSLRHVKTLSLTGASDAFVEEMIACCPGAEKRTSQTQDKE